MTKLRSPKLIEKYRVNRDAQNYIFNLTNGHPGVVDSIMDYLFQVCDYYMATCIVTVRSAGNAGSTLTQREKGRLNRKFNYTI